MKTDNIVHPSLNFVKNLKTHRRSSRRDAAVIFNAVNGDVQKESLLGPTPFLIYVNDLLKYILRSFVNIYADDTSIQ